MYGRLTTLYLVLKHASYFQQIFCDMLCLMVISRSIIALSWAKKIPSILNFLYLRRTVLEDENSSFLAFKSSCFSLVITLLPEIDINGRSTPLKSHTLVRI